MEETEEDHDEDISDWSSLDPYHVTDDNFQFVKMGKRSVLYQSFYICILIFEFSHRRTSLKNIDVFKNQLKTTTDAYKKDNGLQTEKEKEFMEKAKE